MNRLRSHGCFLVLLSGMLIFLLACPVLAEEEEDGIPIPEAVKGLMWQMGWYQITSLPQSQVYHHPLLSIVADFHFDAWGPTRLRVVTRGNLNQPGVIEVVRLGYFLLRIRVAQEPESTLKAQADHRAGFLVSLVQQQLSLHSHTSFVFDQLRVQGERQPRRQLLELSLP